MTASPTADMTESFMHVTDHSARLSSIDPDDTTRSLADIRELIRLAQKHDEAVKESRSGVHREPEKKKAFRNLSSSAQSTPLQRPLKEEVDAARLFSLLQPFLEKYLGEKGGNGGGSGIGNIGSIGGRSRLGSIADDPFTTPRRSVVESESDSENSHDLRVDDTFDKPARKVSPVHPASSPVTTPPLSRENKDFGSEDTIDPEHSDTDAGDEVEPDSDVCKYLGNVPQVELADLTADEIQMDGEKKPDQAKEVAELKMQLEQAKQQNREMANEISYLRDKLAKDVRFEKTSPPPSAGSIPINGENVEACFRPYYSKLQLDKVDGLSDVEKSNMIKNLMLSLLVSDFDHMRTMAPRVGDYLRITSRFLDKLHARFYECEGYSPSKYLRDYSVESMEDFQECLDGMMELIQRDVPSEE
ncbi:hypothetical protein FT663_05110 [Candidozyma haemuli var. vulneris]|uniref:Uncharacterized protein n=1 Tax=Candidozyma haemuli TaxID=45357 RepID=A0A2V1AUI7_9ASCO|nr:hypothetical protein CXQ85_004479 [[Candida] haemuloni]KAF3985329.1 hypothetical protein FT662_05217 [[Candida] haemuloni var. vulneris]KAF3985896.1 hypothetical protein FT663_05110 [[Candida] haemuloni var. vulneris]PVH20963.1 hypothetical protein CXQ85_004479 [[Candida] haemuloni]